MRKIKLNLVTLYEIPKPVALCHCVKGKPFCLTSDLFVCNFVTDVTSFKPS